MEQDSGPDGGELAPKASHVPTCSCTYYWTSVGQEGWVRCLGRRSVGPPCPSPMLGKEAASRLFPPTLGQSGLSFDIQQRRPRHGDHHHHHHQTRTKSPKPRTTNHEPPRRLDRVSLAPSRSRSPSPSLDPPWTLLSPVTRSTLSRSNRVAHIIKAGWVAPSAS